MKLIPALLLTVLAAPTPQIRYFRYQRPVQLPPSASTQACTVIDATAFAHAAPGLADLRLYRDHTESPYLIHQARPTAAPPQTVALLNPGVRAGRTVFDAAMPGGSYSDLDLVVTGRDFIATVTVYGGQRATAVNTRIGSFTIFDLTGQKLGRSTVLHLPESNLPFLHFEVNGPLAPAQFQRLAYQRQAAEPARYLNVARQVRFEQNGRDTVATFTLPAKVPVDRIVFAPPAAPVNFSRDVEIVVAAPPARSDDPSRQYAPSSWNGNILRIHRVESSHRLDEEKLAIDVPFGAFNYPSQWTITVDNGDDTPIAFAAVNLQMVERDLCFDASSPASFTLYYGDPVLSAPRYDYAVWSSAGTSGATATLGPQQPNPVWQPRPDTRPFTENHPLLLWLALLAVVALLAWIAFGSVKRIGQPR